MAGVDLEATKAAHEQVKKKSSSFRGKTPFFKFKEGPNQVRILPPFGESRKFWVECKTAYQVGPKGNTVIPREQFGLSCPLQKKLDELYARNDEASKKTANAMFPKTRFYMWIVDRADEAKGPQLLDCNQFLFRDITGIMGDSDYGDITDAFKGTDLTITYVDKKNTANGFPSWNPLAKRNSSPLGTAEQIAEWTGTDYNALYEVGQPSDEGYIEACLEGTVEDYLKSLNKDAGTTPESKEVSTGSSTPTPPPASTSPPPKVEAMIQCPGDPDQKFWIAHPLQGGAVVEALAKDIAMLVKQGYKDMQMMSYDQSSGWNTPAGLGFKEAIPEPPKPATPPPPAAPPGPPKPATPPAPAAPASPSGPAQTPGSSDEDALMRQLEEIRKKKAEAAGKTESGVASDLRSQLGG